MACFSLFFDSIPLLYLGSVGPERKVILNH